MDGARERATLGGGCFWCLEAVFELLNGVTRVTSGYAGGHVGNPSYAQVCTGSTGHAEVVEIEFDPTTISYRDLLGVFFSTHDPTTLNRQGGDVGTQYRSRDLHPFGCAGRGRASGDRRDHPGGTLDRSDRHRSDADRPVLSGGGLPPGVFPQQPEPALLRRGRGSQGGEVQEAVPRSSPGDSNSVNIRSVINIWRRPATVFPGKPGLRGLCLSPVATPSLTFFTGEVWTTKSLWMPSVSCSVTESRSLSLDKIDTKARIQYARQVSRTQLSDREPKLRELLTEGGYLEA